MIAEAEEANHRIPKDIIIDHPRSTLHGYEYSVALNLFGVNNGKNHSANIRIDYVAMVMLMFQGESRAPNVTQAMIDWEMAAFEWVKHNGTKQFPNLFIDCMGDKVCHSLLLHHYLTHMCYRFWDER